MNTNQKNIIFYIICAFLLVACSPTDHEEKSSGVNQETQAPSTPQAPKKTEDGLTRQQKEQLEINEDEVMNPFPG